MDRTSIEQLTFERYTGTEIGTIVDELAQLRMTVFRDFPYLYEGSLAYERNYLKTYVQAKQSFVLLVRTKDQVVGATTGITLLEETGEIVNPILEAGYPLDSSFYLGESILLPEYRGLGIGHRFFDERELFAASIPGIDTCFFCSVLRPDNHPLKPSNYRDNSLFWQKRGYELAPGLICEMEWLDRGESIETKKKLQFWKKKIR